MEGTEGELPTGWGMIQLQELVSADGVFKDGDWVESKDQDPNGPVRLVQLADIGDMRFLDKSRRFMNEERADALNCTFLKKGDLLISRLGDPLGKTCIYPALEDRAVTVVDVCVLRPAQKGIEPKLLGYFLNGMVLRQVINAQASGTTRKRITGKKLKILDIPVPPVAEQQRIVEKIETLFARLDKGEEAVRDVQKLLTRYRQSVLKSAVTGQLTADWRAERKGRLVHGRDLLDRILETGRESWDGRGKYKAPNAPGTTELPDLPTGWVWASVDQLARIMGGLTKNSKRKEMPMTRPMLRVANVYQNRLELDDIHETGITEGELARVSLQVRDILVVEGNGSKSQIGRMAVWSDEIPNAVHQNHLIKVRLHEAVLAEFMVAWFQSPIGRQVVEKVASSTSGLYTLSISKIAAMVAPLPSLEEVDEIVRGVEEAHSKIAVLEEWCETELKRSASLRQSILKDAFAGKLVPQDPTDEPASALLARIAAEKPTAKKTRRKTSA